MIFRLAPPDYHRFHFPFACIPGNPRIITGKLESVNPVVYASGIQPLVENERHVIELKSNVAGDVVMIPVGACFVGKIIETFKAGLPYNKGDEVGYFAFGGSTVVLLFKKNTITLRDDLVRYSALGYETAVKMGEGVAFVGRVKVEKGAHPELVEG